MSEQKITVEDVIINSNLSETLQKLHIEFCYFLKNNEFLIEPEGHIASISVQVERNAAVVANLVFVRQFLERNMKISVLPF